MKAIHLIVLLLAGLSGSSPQHLLVGHQQATTNLSELGPLIPREVLFGNPEKFNPLISPDGKMLAYQAPDKGILNVWVRTMGQNDDRAVTSDKRRGIQNYFWQQDSEHIIYLQDQDGNEKWHIYQTNLKTKLTRDLTPFNEVNAQIIATNPNFPDQMLVGLNIRNPGLHDVYRINLRNGAVEMDTENPGDVSSWTVDNDFRVRGTQARPPDGSTEIRIRDTIKSPWRKLYTWGADESFGRIVGFTPNNRGVLIISSADANAARLIEIDIATNRTSVLFQDTQFDIAGVLRHPSTRALEALWFTRERNEWMVIDKSLQGDFDAIRKAHGGEFYILSRDKEDRTWVVAYVVDNGPADHYAYDRSTKKSLFLFSHQPALANYKLARMQPVSFQARDSMTIYGYLTLPVGVEPKNLPMVLLVHGGPWGRDVWGLNLEAQWLANRGYAVLQINFRGSTGYGKAYLNAGDREWGGKMQDDLIDGKNWAVKQGYADPKRVSIYGGSYGGYAVLAALAFTPDEFACGLDLVGPSDLITLIKSTPQHWVGMKMLLKKRVGDIETEEEFLKSRSPLYKADQIKSPLLIAQGANDPRVLRVHSDQIVAAMRKSGRQVEYLVFPDEGHGLARPENRLRYYAAVEQFLAKHLGGRAEPPSEKEKTDDLRK